MHGSGPVRPRALGTLLGILDLCLLAGCQQEIPGAKPWTSEEFQNDPDEFPFAVIGDRTGGANVQHTFALAMGQLNLLQPEFVINVGDLIEGYSEDKDEINQIWDEADDLTARPRMPFFRTRGNHDVSNPEAKEVWAERYGPNYYHFRYRGVLFMVLDSEEDPRPQPPDDMKEQIKLYKRLQVEDPPEARKMLAEFMKSEAIVFLHEPCWENPSASFKAIEEGLQDRKYTFIAGHLHYYDAMNSKATTTSRWVPRGRPGTTPAPETWITSCG